VASHAMLIVKCIKCLCEAYEASV